jgi:hypothetical protein
MLKKSSFLLKNSFPAGPQGLQNLCRGAENAVFEGFWMIF